jgi:hypothetical protein
MTLCNNNTLFQMTIGVIVDPLAGVKEGSFHFMLACASISGYSKKYKMLGCAGQSGVFSV